MQTTINLASQPYVNLRGEYRRWTIITAVVVAVTLVLGIAAGLVLHNTRILDTQIKTLEKEHGRLNAQIDKVQQTLHEPGNVELISRSQFLNDIMLRKSFSWTCVFEQFEKIMPAHAQIVHIQPELRPDHTLHIHLLISGNREGATKLLRNLEITKPFSSPRLNFENYEQNQRIPGVGNTTFDIEATYSAGDDVCPVNGNKKESADKKDDKGEDRS